MGSRTPPAGEGRGRKSSERTGGGDMPLMSLLGESGRDDGGGEGLLLCWMVEGGSRGIPGGRETGLHHWSWSTH